MEHLPPVGWADVATKRDIDQLAVATKRDIDQLAVGTKRDIDRMAGAIENLGDKLRAEWRHELLNVTIAIVAANTALAGAVLAVAKLA